MESKFINWLEIPVHDMNRAREFYETILEISLVDVNVGGEIYSCFPDKSGEGFNGALVKYDFTQPGKTGPLIYLNANPDISVMLKKIESAGGKILLNRKEIASGFGYYAIFEDSEGNMLALQADN